LKNRKVLLDREKKSSGITPWVFPGGEVEAFDKSLEETCAREVKEELGIEIEIIKPLKPILLYKNNKVIILIHYLAKRIGEITPGDDIAEWNWFPIDNLPENTMANVIEVISDYKKQYDL